MIRMRLTVFNILMIDYQRLLPLPLVKQLTKQFGWGKIAEDNLKASLEAFKTGNENLIKKVYETESLINLLETDITNYLVKLSNSELGEAQKTTISAYFHVVNDIERIGDHAENIADWATEITAKGISFSEDAKNELNEIAELCITALDTGIDCFANYDDSKANEVKNLEEQIDILEKDLRSSHIRRLNNGQCSAIAGSIYFDLISNLERVGDHSLNIAEILSKK